MNKRIMTLTIALLMSIIGITSEVSADISNAAVLFLRIAPGSRPAGMGEAFVAIADDATTTHWNPAGLGTYPIADSWIEVKIPLAVLGGPVADASKSGDASTEKAVITPIQAFAPLKSGGGNDYQAYDLWVLTAKGLARYDNKDWNYEEILDTKTDQTLRRIVSSYFNLTDEARIDLLVKQVAEVNSKGSLEDVTSLREKVMAAVPEEYTLRESMIEQFDTLVAAYNTCLINWERYGDIEKNLLEGLKDSVLTEKELDRINFAVEKSKNRFIPEELTIPYSIVFTGEPTSIASISKHLLVGTSDGMVVFNGKRWRILTTEDNLPSNNVTSLFAMDETVFIGTDRGLARFDGLRLNQVADTTEIPAGEISAIGGNSASNLWIVVDNDLYAFDGTNWSNSREYTTVLDDTKEKIAERFAFGTSAIERDRFMAKLVEMNSSSAEGVVDGVESEASLTPDLDTLAVTDEEGEMKVAGASETDSEVVSEDVSEIISEATSEDTLKEETASLVENQEAVQQPALDFSVPLEPGTVIRLPFVSKIKGQVNDIYVDNSHQVWIGTSYGVWMFDGREWKTQGYEEHLVEEGQTLEDLAGMKSHATPEEASQYAELLQDLNDVGPGMLASGTKVLIYRNPAGTAVNAVEGRGSVIYFGTKKGLIEYDGSVWRRVYLKGLERSEVVGVAVHDDELWFAGRDKMVIKANGRTELSLMHVRWLPELASDLYYEFASFVTNKEGWGTFGGNIAFISYGSITRTNEQGTELGSFDAFDFAATASYGTALSAKLRGGVSVRIIYSRLAEVGAGKERGKGTSAGIAVDFGFIYEWSPRLNLGLAVTNIGPKMAYIDAAQADPLPTNLAFGFAYKVLRSDYYQFLVTMEANKMLVGLDAGLKEFKTSEGLILNGGAEFSYAGIFALRAGYIYDDEGQVKTVTLGVGIKPLDLMKFDFAYIPSNKDVVLANTLRVSLTFNP